MQIELSGYSLEAAHAAHKARRASWGSPIAESPVVRLPEQPKPVRVHYKAKRERKVIAYNWKNHWFTPVKSPKEPKGEVIAPKFFIIQVMKAVCNEYQITLDELRSARREVRVCYPRQIAIWICSKACWNKSLPEIGRHFGGRDHSTVIFARKKMQRLYDSGEFILPESLAEFIKSSGDISDA